MNILIAPILSALCAVSGDTGSLVLQAEVVHGPDGPIEAGRILIRDGKIEAIGAGLELPGDGHLIELEGHLSAGLVAMGDQTGLKGEALDSTRQIMDGADLAFGYDKTDDGWGAFLEAGVTAVLLTPKPGALVGGRTAVVKPAGAMVQRRAPLACVFLKCRLQERCCPYKLPRCYLHARAANGNAHGWICSPRKRPRGLVGRKDQSRRLEGRGICQAARFDGRIDRGFPSGRSR